MVAFRQDKQGKKYLINNSCFLSIFNKAVNVNGKINTIKCITAKPGFFYYWWPFWPPSWIQNQIKDKPTRYKWIEKLKKKKEDALIFDTPKVKAVSIANFTNKPYYYNYY